MKLATLASVVALSLGSGLPGERAAEGFPFGEAPPSAEYSDSSAKVWMVDDDDDDDEGGRGFRFRRGGDDDDDDD